MSNVGLVESSDLNTIFNSMSYEDGQPGNLASIKKWLLERPGGILSSQVSGTSLGNESDGQTIAFGALSQAIGVDVKARLLTKDTAIVDAYTKIYKASDATTVVLSNAEKQDRELKFQQLIKKHASDLVTLEACAGNVPTWVIQKYDQPIWLQSTNNAMSTELRNQLESGNSQVQLHLSTKTYGLKQVIELMAAVVQVDGPIPVFITLTDDSSVRQLLPVVHLLDCINNARIRSQPIDVLLVAPKLWDAKLMAKLAEADKTAKKSKGVLVIGDSGINKSEKVTTGAWKLSTGQTVHHVIDNSADIASAISSVSRNTWFCGVEMNHRCRSLVFTHEAVYTQVIEELKKNVESIKVNSWAVKSLLTNCDFVARNVDASSVALRSISKLGAKLLATKSDYSVPSVVYDIGTSSDLIAMREAGLGHILVLIPYRSCTELFSLGNNFGVPDQLFLHSNCFNISKDMIKRLNDDPDAKELQFKQILTKSQTTFVASQTLVNSAPVQGQPLTNLSWKVVSKTSTPTGGSTETGSSGSLKSAASSSKWRELSVSCRIQKLNQLIKSTDVDPSILSLLLSHYFDATRRNLLNFPCKTDDSASGIIVADATGIVSSDFISVLIACVLREKPVVVVSVGKDISKQITQSVQDNLPPGLVSFVAARNTSDVASLVNDWDLVWVLQGTEVTMDTDFIPTTTAKGPLLISVPNIKPDGLHAKVAIESGFKKLYL